MTKKNIVGFAQNKKTFTAYIEEAKRSYRDFDMSQKWEADKWRSEGAMASSNSKQYLYFATVRKSKHLVAQTISDRDFIDWCKAQITQRSGRMSFGHQKTLLGKLKHLHQALIQTKHRAAPWLIDDAVLERLEQNMKDSEYGEIYAVLDLAKTAAKDLSIKGIIAVGITFTHTHTRRMGADQKKLNQLRKKATEVNDNERDGEERCMSMEALHAIIWLSHNATNIWERCIIRYYHIMIGTGFRIGELLRVRHDSMICVHELSEETGKPVYAHDKQGKPIYVNDANGNPLYEQDIDGFPILDDKGKRIRKREHSMIRGIHYHPEKGHKASYKWLDPTTAPLIVAAFEFINEATKECRAQLLHLEENPASPIIWHEKTMSFRDVNEHFVTYSTQVNKHCRDAFVKRMNNANIFPYSNIVDTSRLKADRNSGPLPTQPIYRVKDLNTYYYEAHKKAQQIDVYQPFFTFHMGSKGKIKKAVTIKKSELLCICPAGVLLTEKNLNSSNQALNRLYPDVIGQSLLGQFSGSVGGLSSLDASVFHRYKLTEKDGSPIKVLTHDGRHQQNTFLALANVTEHQQAILIGRADIAQNPDYQHTNVKEKTQGQVPTTQSIRARQENEANQMVPAKGKNSGLGLLEDLGITTLDTETEMGTTPDKFTVQRKLGVFDQSDDFTPFLKKTLTENNLLGELQDDFNKIKSEKDLQTALEFIDTHGKFFNIVANGGCIRNLAVHGCPSKMKCLSDGGCFHLVITGRIGELGMIQETYLNLSLNVDRMTRLDAAGELKTNRQREVFETEKYNLAQMAIVKRTAENYSGFIPVRVFESGKQLNHNAGKVTVIDKFSQAQDELKEQGSGKEQTLDSTR
jgi:hypothetical protein